MTDDDHLIALISATSVAIPPATEALAGQLPGTRVWNLLDDRLLQDAADAGGLTEPLADRMRRLIGHAVDAGADGILLTCSMYGPVAQETSAPIPVLAPDEAAFAEAGSGAYRTVLVVASLESALADSVQRFGQAVATTGQQVEVRGLAVPAAKDAAGANDPTALADILIDACRPQLAGVDAILLAQYSLAPAQTELQTALDVPVISGPRSAAVALGERLRSQPTAAPLGAIADDYTGGTDIALAFRQAGLRTLLFFGPPEATAELPPHDAIVIALKSRTTPPEQAVDESLAAWDWLSSVGVGQLYFKYCSTFDSTPQGNIGPVTDALAEAIGATTVVTTPSSPAHRRTVYAGQLFVDGVPLAETHMATHPLTPMTDSSLPRVLAAQTDRPVEALPLATLRQGVNAVRGALTESGQAGVRHLVADAVEDGDLQVLARAVADQPLVAGAAGLAGALAELRAPARPELATAADPVGPGPAAVLAGSCSARTLEQIADFEARGGPSYRVDALSVPDAGTLAERALTWVEDLPDGSTPLLYTSLPAEQLQQVQDQLGTVASAALLENTLAQIATGLVQRGVRRLVSAGGETSGAIVHGLGVQGAAVGGDVSPGVPWIYTLGGEALALLLKSGNFGDVAMFSRAVDGDQDWGVSS
ncbi:MAG TPA: hypothetical protein H9815_11160 [Candidatus Ruania gallistercoris]|uniref:3-oxo-tetronate kinase n=1 Tax=Candidatus Ruania gallistercoris TaxID=2838746 RepID=A0A9D2EF64_9MICO|nr:hypothetical protein [Candidatus Ruania gallistercoris]